MVEPNPKLLAFFEKMAKPVEHCRVSLDIHGIFAFPENWIGVDEANPFFSYKVHFQGMDILDGTYLIDKLKYQ